MYWGILAHLGFNMWDDRPEAEAVAKNPYRLKSDVLRCDRPMWDELIARMAEVGMNEILIDIGEGIRYDSHPELAAEGAWTPAEMADEVVRLRELGIEAHPKLNFSASHDEWLGEYSRMLSTKPYYQVCADLIAETCEIFDNPALFHIGMDEETLQHQRGLSYVVIRQHELWYSDLRFYADEVEKAGARPWMWSDRIWHHEQEYLQHTPKSILQSNWYYQPQFEFEEAPEQGTQAHRVHSYNLLEEAGFDQVPTGANWVTDDNFASTVQYCDEVIDPSRLKGYITAPWYPTVSAERTRLLAAVDQVGEQVAARGEA